MKLNLTKSQIGREEVNFLGFTIGTGITASQHLFEKIAELSKPHTVKKMQRALGKIGYLRNHVKGYNRAAKHCYRGITREGHQKAMSHKEYGRQTITWDKKMEESWENLK